MALANAHKVSIRCILGFLCLWLTACQGVLPSPTPTPTLGPTATNPLPTAVPATPTPSPLGSPDNPLLIGVVTDASSTAPAAPGDLLGQTLSQKTGLSIKVSTYSTYPLLLEDMDGGKLPAAWLPPLTYLWASQRGLAQVALAANHFGVYRYGAQFLVNAGDNYTVYYDANKNQSTADAANALRQFAGKQPCWVDATSASGYVLPKGILAQESIQTGSGVFTLDHTAVVRALYARGICDFGVTFAVMGDPRTATAVQKDMPDIMQKVIVAWQTPAVIPNLALVYAPRISTPTRSKINDALIGLALTKDGQASLAGALGYEIGGLKPATEDFYRDLLAAVQASGIELDSLVGK
ncbi:MAG TPA: PhnD/SsuA/transferrin family substrate-binding protein [Anaerolineaceae bacterium]